MELKAFRALTPDLQESVKALYPQASVRDGFMYELGWIRLEGDTRWGKTIVVNRHPPGSTHATLAREAWTWTPHVTLICRDCDGPLHFRPIITPPLWFFNGDETARTAFIEDCGPRAFCARCDEGDDATSRVLAAARGPHARYGYP